MNSTQQRLARWSLAALWFWTGLSAVFFAPAIGYHVLARGGVVGTLADVLLYTGAALDIGIAVWLLSARYRARCCLAQLALVTVYTALLSAFDASFWVHPFGPLSKNIPIMALIFILYQSDKKN